MQVAKKIKSIVLLGTSDLRHIVLELQNKLSSNGIEVINLIFEASGSEHCLFEIIKNQKEIKKADLIFYDAYSEDISLNKNVEFVCQTIANTFNILSSFSIPVVNLMLPTSSSGNLSNDQQIITNMYLYLSNYHSINTVYFGDKDKSQFFYSILLKDKIHFYDRIIIESICILIDNFNKLSIPRHFDPDIINNFIVLNVDAFDKEKKLFQYTGRQFEYIQILKDEKLVIPKQFKDMHIHSFFSFNAFLCSVLKFDNGFKKLNSLIRPAHQFKSLSNLLKITNSTILEYSENYSNDIDPVEPMKIEKQKKHLGFFNLGDLLLVKDNFKFSQVLKVDIKNLSENIQLKKDLDYSHLILNLDFLKGCIEDYIRIHEPIKFIPLRRENSYLKNEIERLKYFNNINELKRYYARAEVKNYLTYRLGEAYLNSNIFTLFFNLFYEYKKYKSSKENNIKIRDYIIYEETMLMKNSIQCQLGQVIINAHSIWYKGGYFKLWFDVRKLKKEFNLTKK
ncbi:hypothetical protein [Campylobacter aviculae]|uniref:Uncharacterized protein n=1 Tax=Campylobacter aviculae TaxID=2510190 RepID=A0A4U7BPJ2_9BACT|nr:hypothetical protein [Campylobacter aviculae]TKX32205.1 hypothetical protein CQA76_04770 [Campylobacter aviculae]